MMPIKKILRVAALCWIPLQVLAVRADEAPQALIETRADTAKVFVPSSAQVTVAPSEAPASAVITIATGPEGYPGVSLKPPQGVWDLSKFGHVEARVTNLGEKAASLSLRVDNDGNWQDNPWNTESISLQPGESGTLSTIFGFAYGKKPNFPLDSSKVSNLLLFAAKSDATQKFRIENVQAAGVSGEKPAVAPNDVRIVPEGGWLLGPNAKLEAGQISAERATAQIENGALNIAFPAAQDAKVFIKPLQGRWDLRDWLQMRVKLQNSGAAPLNVKLRLESNGGPSPWTSANLDGGAEREIIVPFYDATPEKFGDKKKPEKITHDAVSALVITADKADAARTLVVKSVRAEAQNAPLPAWLGQRPPVAGDWVQTLDENFDKPLDPKLWSVYGENYWDKQSHWSRDNVIVENGVAKLRYEKKTGFNNDDPTKKQTPWQSGYLHTFDRWAQRYGYFEARMKLSTAPGVWPAFWMMPDRGRGDEVKNFRQDTGKGGMEFDIMENLSRWGLNRYNVAVHYDGYGKEHKSLGSERVYVQPDKDGYITSGLLWTPGSAIFYANGVEVARWDDERVSNVPEILMFTLPMGGWDNNALDEAKLPTDFAIDYVRVWQRRDLASPNDGIKPLIP